MEQMDSSLADQYLSYPSVKLFRTSHHCFPILIFCHSSLFTLDTQRIRIASCKADTEISRGLYDHLVVQPPHFTIRSRGDTWLVHGCRETELEFGFPDSQSRSHPVYFMLSCLCVHSSSILKVKLILNNFLLCHRRTYTSRTFSWVLYFSELQVPFALLTVLPH